MVASGPGSCRASPRQGRCPPCPHTPFSHGLSTPSALPVASPLHLQQCSWPGAWGLGVLDGWGRLCMGYRWPGQADAQAEPCPHPSGASCPLGHPLAQGGRCGTSGSRTGTARACGRSRSSLLPPRAACTRAHTPCAGQAGGGGHGGVQARVSGPRQDLGPECTPGWGCQLTLSHRAQTNPGAILKNLATPSGTTKAGFPTVAAHCRVLPSPQ